MACAMRTSRCLVSIGFPSTPKKYLTDKCLNVQKSPYTERGYLPTTQEIVLHMVDFRLQIFRQVNGKDTRQRIIIWKS